MKKLEVWSSDYCGYCKRAITLIEDLGIPYRLHKIEDSPEYWAQMMNTWGFRTVPQIFLEEDHQERESLKLLGGFEDFNRLVESGQIWKLVGDKS